MQVKDKYFNGRDVDGEVGIEIEMEGKHFPDPVSFTHATDGVWAGHHDGSLRGSSIEIVLFKPVPRDMVNEVLASAVKTLINAGSELIPSVRTGVHVHINIRHMTEEEVFKFMFCWFLMESVLVRYCGEDRVGNLFCLRGSDAEAYMDLLESAVKEGDFNILYTDELRYSAMNPKALIEYGSLEFRCLKTPEDIMDVSDWVDILLAVKDFSLTIEDPAELLDMISRVGGDEIAEKCFGPLLEKLPVEDWTMEMFSGLRLIQPIIYARNWNLPEEEDVVFATELPESWKAAKKAGILTAKEVVENNV
jgi:hypothetical protein